MDRERPRGREKNVTGEGSGLGRKGSGLGTGPVGSKDGYSGRGSSSGGGGGRKITRGAGLNSEGKGIVFSLPVTDVMGVARMMDTQEEQE